MELNHLDSKGHPHMVDISTKDIVYRQASASGRIKLSETTIKYIQENQIAKGNVITIAETAGIMAAKSTAQIIPLCHPIQLSHVSCQIEIENDGLSCTSNVKNNGRTGVEMEALTVVSACLLTVYDMCKAIDKQMEISNIRVLNKTKSAIVKDNTI